MEEVEEHGSGYVKGAPYTPERAVRREDPWEEGKGKKDE